MQIAWSCSARQDACKVAGSCTFGCACTHKVVHCVTKDMETYTLNKPVLHTLEALAHVPIDARTEHTIFAPEMNHCFTYEHPPIIPGCYSSPVSGISRVRSSVQAKLTGKEVNFGLKIYVSSLAKGDLCPHSLRTHPRRQTSLSN